MKKHFYLHYIMLFWGVWLCAQQGYQETKYRSFQSIKELDALCPVQDEKIGFNADFEKITPSVAKSIIDSLLRRMSIYKTYPIRECEKVAKNNAYADIYMENGRAREYIIYSQSWLNSLVAENQSKFAAYFVLAHEVGHHVNGHRQEFEGSNKTIEKQADEYAGFTLARLGASLDETLLGPRATSKLVTHKYASHPGRIERVKAAFKGWFNVHEFNPKVIAENKEAIEKYKREIKAWQDLVQEERDKIRDKIKEEKEKQQKEIARLEEEKKEEEERRQKEIARLEEEKRELKKQEKAAEIIKRYFKALGGVAKVNSIRQLRYTETTTGSEQPDVVYQYEYEQRSPTHLVISDVREGEVEIQYQISNDTLYHKFPGKKWRLGRPKVEQMNEDDLKKFIGSSTGDFLEDFNLFASPGLVTLKDTVDFKGVKCYQLEVKEKRVEEIMDKNRSGTLSRLQQFRYYRIDNALLEGIEKIKNIKYFKKGKIVEANEVKTTITNQEYRDVNGIKFPHEYEIETDVFQKAELLETKLVNKKVSAITFQEKSE